MTYRIGLDEYRRQYYQANKDAILARTNARYDEKREEILAKARERHASGSHYRSKIVDRCRSRARRCGVAFNITVEDIVIPDVCPVLGIPLKRNQGESHPAPNSPSVDRIEPAKGYIKGNVQIISQKANIMKNNASPDELRLFAQWVLRTQEQDAA